jgi:hypothetical protein
MRHFCELASRTSLIRPGFPADNPISVDSADFRDVNGS